MEWDARWKAGRREAVAQKGGATWSRVRIASRPDAIFATRSIGEADLVIACDAIVGASRYTLSAMQRPRLRR